MQNINFFLSLFKYKPADVTPEENFITEALVYLLNISKTKETEFLLKFLNLLGLPNHIDINEIEIDTQLRFPIQMDKTELIAIPDISILYEQTYYFIEVKMAAQLNSYTVQDAELDTFNQIQKYQQIKIPLFNTKVFTLTLQPVDLDDKFLKPQYKLLWTDIYILISDYLDQNNSDIHLLREFKTFMEKNNMDLPEVSFQYTQGVESLINLWRQLEKVLGDASVKYTKSFGYNWFGYYVSNMYSSGNDAWIGSKWDPTYLKFQFFNPIATENIKKYDLDRSYHFIENKSEKSFDRYFYFKQAHYFSLDAKEQIEILANWFNENYQLLNELSKEDYKP